MPAITAILHTQNDALRIARAVESLRSCDEVLVIDHGSSDETCAVARRFGAHVIASQTKLRDAQLFLIEARHDWILCLLPTESVSEGLEASLLEWKLASHAAQTAFGVSILEETPQGWHCVPPETRLVNRADTAWDGWKPPTEDSPIILNSHLLHLRLP
jgi:glycosyltransferase involved in cell wall biosynthesis